MFRIPRRWLLLPVLVAFISLAIPAPGRAGDIDMSGVWKGTYAVGTGEAKAIVTLKKNGDKYSGTIALTDEKINVSIRNASMDDGYFAVSGVLPSKTPEGKTVQAHITFGGFVDPDAGVWDGNWTVSDKEGNVAIGNLFTFERESGSGKAAISDGGMVANPEIPTTNTGGLIGTRPKIAKSEPVKPSGGGISGKSATDGGAGSEVTMAGHWQGTYNQTNKQAGTLSIDLREVGGSYEGDGQAINSDGTEIPPMTFTSGKMTGKKFVTDGAMTLITEDGEEFPATITLSGDVTGRVWRGNILVKTEIEGEETTVISGMFRLERSGDAPSSPSKINNGASGTSGGGMSGRGKTVNSGR